MITPNLHPYITAANNSGFFVHIKSMYLKKYLQWMWLFEGAESNKRCRQLRDQVLQDSKYKPETIFRLLLNVGQFEFKLKEVS